jgi:hypothetical protein
MSCSSLNFLVLSVAFAAAALAQDTTTTTARPEVKETTEVQGDVPQDVVGRWLIVARVKVANGQPRPVARTMEIRRKDSTLELVLPLEVLPAQINDKLNAAIEKNTDWTPAPEDLREVADTWGTLDKIDSDKQSAQNKLIAASSYPPEFKEDEDTKDTKFAITAQENFSGSRGALRSYTLHGVRELGPKTMSGSFVTTTIAAAPIPIPITLKGDFTAYRLEAGKAAASAGGSWFQRLFSGCQR